MASNSEDLDPRIQVGVWFVFHARIKKCVSHEECAAMLLLESREPLISNVEYAAISVTKTETVSMNLSNCSLRHKEMLNLSCLSMRKSCLFCLFFHCIPNESSRLSQTTC